MKTKANFRIMGILYSAVILLVMVLNFSCERELVEKKLDDVVLGEETGGGSNLKTSTMLEEVMYSKTFVRKTGKTTTYEDMVAGADFGCFLPPYKLCLKNGDDNGDYMVSSAIVKLDGEVLFGPSNFSQNSGSCELEVELTAESKLEVILDGKPENYITVSITGYKINSWARCYGGNSYEEAYCIIQTTDGGYAVAGNSWSNDEYVTGNHGQGDYWVVKLNSIGDVEWEKCYGGSSYEFARSIIQTTDGGYAVAGYTYSNDGDVNGNHGNTDYWVVKLNSNGIIEWDSCYGGAAYEKAYSIIEISGGGYMIVGSANYNDGDVSGNHGNDDYWLIKLDSEGNIDWQKCYGGSRYECATSIIRTTDGGYAVTGYTNSKDGDVSGYHVGVGWYYDLNTDYWVIKLNSNGVIEWESCYGGTSFDRAYSIIQTVDGGYAVVGYTYSVDADVSGNPTNSGYSDCWLVKLDSEGGILWESRCGESSHSIDDDAYSIVQTTDGGYAVAYITPSNHGELNAGYDNYRILKLDSGGNVIWQKCYGGNSLDCIHSIIQTIDGGYAVAGYSHSDDGDVNGNHGGTDYWVIKLDQNGNLNIP